MTAADLQARLHALCQTGLPLPGGGNTPARHARLMEVAREDVSLAKLAEAHWDAVAIIAEAGREALPGAIYAVWASEMPGKELVLEATGNGYVLSGTKMFCSGAGLVDRALISVGAPLSRLVEVDLNAVQNNLSIDLSAWKTDAFRLTQTGTITFDNVRVDAGGILGEPGWYVARQGFWHGACGPAACWAGGVAGLLDVAMRSSRNDPHTLAHLAAMHANIWALEAILRVAGLEIDHAPSDLAAAQILAIQTRHLVEQVCTDTLRRFARAYGPFPLAMNEETSRRYQETDLFLRQFHGERDLEGLGHLLKGK